jgi:tetratricopeptide (TPR) repeat protein
MLAAMSWPRAVRRAASVAAILASATAPGVAVGEPPAAGEPSPYAPAGGDADVAYNRGVRMRVVKQWPAAVAAFREATVLRPDFAEAWSELGYALRNQGRYAESLDAYDEALRLRPSFPEALEYLGEAYVKLGRLDDARRVLDRLRPLDAARAQELDEEIRTATR